MAGFRGGTGGTVVVAVDGLAGAGKSTVARAVAAALGCPYLDTGAFYRAVTLAVVRAGADAASEQAVLQVTAAACLDYAAGAMLLDGEDVSEAVRTPEVGALVSAVSAFPEVRRLVVERQRDWVEEHGGRVVVEGRDIGTVVFPEAAVKVFLTASAAARARRRVADAEAAGQTLQDVEDHLRARDHADSTRAASPLRSAADAVTIDTTDLTVAQVVAVILGLIAEAEGDAGR
ncbi:MAG: (d)CMP kinase [Actinobacteria bacterium]|nr:(d)CMP kinase [Actinomycetota bacterium]